VGISRRSLVIGSGLAGAAVGVGGWALLADARLLPGRSLVDRALGRCDIDSSPPQASPGRVFRSSFFSRKRNRSVNYMLAYPPKSGPGTTLPVCICLHGYGQDERSPFDGLGFHRILAATVGSYALGGRLVGSSVPPFVLASVSGGDGYWHPRPGDDPLGLVLTEFPQILAQHGLPVDRFGLLGWSMGGYGALLAATEDPTRFPVVVANSPAVWPSYDEARGANPAAFTSAQEWSSWGDLRPRVERLRYVTARIDYGESDPFAPALDDLRGTLPDPGVLHISPGCHDDRFWRSVAQTQLSLIGTTLTPKKT
jgi:pimeloyl-ACP methyl ester carboxylesterase